MRWWGVRDRQSLVKSSPMQDQGLITVSREATPERAAGAVLVGFLWVGGGGRGCGTAGVRAAQHPTQAHGASNGGGISRPASCSQVTTSSQDPISSTSFINNVHISSRIWHTNHRNKTRLFATDTTTNEISMSTPPEESGPPSIEDKGKSKADYQGRYCIDKSNGKCGTWSDHILMQSPRQSVAFLSCPLSWSLPFSLTWPLRTSSMLQQHVAPCTPTRPTTVFGKLTSRTTCQGRLSLPPTPVPASATCSGPTIPAGSSQSTRSGSLTQAFRGAWW